GAGGMGRPRASRGGGPGGSWAGSWATGGRTPTPTLNCPRVEQAVKTLQGLVADYESQVPQARQRTGDVKSRVFSWITPAAVLVSLVCFRIALSQLCLLSRAWSWLKDRDA